MPVKLNSKLSSEGAEGRIELVPLIDIMFFLLAAFMLVSLSMVNMKSVKVNLPTATSAAAESRKDFVDVSVDRSGATYLDKKPMAGHELVAALSQAAKKTPGLRVVISADTDSRHGDVIRALDSVRSAGVDKIAFDTRPAGKAGNP